MELDQHFMVDERALERVVSAAGLKKGETVLEIGAGTGLLTERIAGAAGRVIAVEIDERFRNQLEGRFRNVKVIIGDILKEIRGIDFDRIVSNIPYSISEALVQELIFHNFKSAVLTVPKGFFYRLTGKSKLGIFAKLFFKVELIGEVPKSAFEPQPRTNSVIVRIAPKRLAGKKRLLKEVFLQRDRKVGNALVEALCRVDGITKNQARERLKKLGNNNLLEKKLPSLSVSELKELVKTFLT